MKKQGAKLPVELQTRLEQQFGPFAVQKMITAFSAKRLPTFRTNTLKATDDDVMQELRHHQIQFERIKTIPHAFRVRNADEKTLFELPMFKEGKVYMQGIASMLPPLALNAQPGEKVLDLCAAPGSKTSQIAALMNGKGEILACEENGVRFQKLEHTLRLQGTANVTARHTDATLIYKEFPEYFDRVLADVPCSAEGRIQLFDPRTFRYWSQKNILAHAKLQRRLLRSAVRALKPGGTLVYSTCTLAPEEDEQMIAWLKEEFPEMALIGKPEYVLPSIEQEGFFVAKMEKAK